MPTRRGKPRPITRDIYYAKYYGKVGGKWPAEEKMKLGVREKK